MNLYKIAGKGRTGRKYYIRKSDITGCISDRNFFLSGLWYGDYKNLSSYGKMIEINSNFGYKKVLNVSSRNSKFWLS